MGGWFICPDDAGNAHEAWLAAAAAQFARHGLGAPHRLAAGTHWVLAAPAANGALPAFARDGADFIAVAGTLFYRGQGGAPALLAFLRDVALPFTGWADVIGNFAAVVFKAGQLHVFGDYFGLLHIFRETGGRFWSTSFLTLTEILPSLTVNRQGLYEYAFSSSPLGNDTLVEEISVLDPHEQVTLAPTPGVHRLRRQFDLSVDPAPIAAQQAAMVERLRTLARPMVAHYGDLIRCPLSGGYDSRLLLALLRDQGARPSIYVYGLPDSEDVQIAKAIGAAEGFAVDHIDKSSRTPPPFRDYAAMVEADFHRVDGAPVDGSLLDLGGNAEARARLQADGALAASGACGEVFRNFFYIMDGSYSPEEVADTFYAQFDPANMTERFDQRAFREQVARKISASIGNLSPQLDRREVDTVYPFFRCRGFFGREISTVNRYGAYFVPFIHPTIVAPAMRLPLDEKNHGVFEGKLVNQLDPQLARHPSAYGHSFAEPPGLTAKMENWVTMVRPPTLRRLSYRINRRLKRLDDGHGHLPDPAYLGRVIDLNFPVMREFFLLETINDAGLMRRVAALEYLATRLGSKLRLG